MRSNALLTVLLLGATAGLSSQDAPANKESDFLSRVRRLTVEGRRAGEGYWSPDGTRLVFQSEREPGNPFYQIYPLDLATGDATRVSPGIGKTTCAFFRPGSDSSLRVHASRSPLEAAAAGGARLPRLGPGSAATRGTTTRRWRSTLFAEQELGHAATPPDQRARLRRRGQLLARRPVDRVLLDARRVQQAACPQPNRSSSTSTPPTSARSTSCAPTGADQKRLTNVPGYDGGPFFSPDGKRIIWRRFDDDGTHRGCVDDEPDGTTSVRLPTSAR